MANYNTTLTINDADFLTKIQRATAEINKANAAAREQNEREKQQVATKKELARVTDQQRRETDRLKEAQEKQNKTAKEGASLWRDALRDIPVIGRAVNLLEGPLGKLAMRYKDAAASGAVLAGVVALLYGQSRKAQGLRDTSIITGVGTERLQSLSAGAEATGADPNQLFQSIGEIRKNQGAALSGQLEQVKSFKTLGIAIEDLRSLQADDLFLKIADRLSEGGASAEEFAAALKVMGEGSKTLLPAMQRDFANAVKEFDKKVVLESTTASLARLGDVARKEWAEFKNTASSIPANFSALLFNGIRATVGTVMAGFGDESMLQGLADDMQGVVGANRAAQEQANKLEAAKNRIAGESMQREEVAVKQAERMLELQEALKAAEFEGLDALQQQQSLKEKIIQAQETINFLQAEGGDNVEEIARQKLFIQEAQNALKGLENSPKNQAAKLTGGTSGDALAKIGIFRGPGGMAPLERAQQEQVRILQDIKQSVDATTRAVEEGLS